MDGRFLQINRVNVKHILLDVQNITVGAFVTAHLNSRKYREVKDLLEQSEPQKEERQEGARRTMQKAIPRRRTMGTRNEDKEGRDKRREGQHQGREGRVELKANEEKKMVKVCTLDRYMRRIVVCTINQLLSYNQIATCNVRIVYVRLPLQKAPRAQQATVVRLALSCSTQTARHSFGYRRNDSRQLA